MSGSVVYRFLEDSFCARASERTKLWLALCLVFAAIPVQTPSCLDFGYTLTFRGSPHNVRFTLNPGHSASRLPLCGVNRTFSQGAL